MSFTVIILEHYDNKAEDAIVHHIGNYETLEKAEKVAKLCGDMIDINHTNACTTYYYRCDILENKHKPVQDTLKDIFGVSKCCICSNEYEFNGYEDFVCDKCI
jgi:3-deoxy-D-arabino-heptulosonate 7-phosphate (DAHP) synthase